MNFPFETSIRPFGNGDSDEHASCGSSRHCSLWATRRKRHPLAAVLIQGMAGGVLLEGESSESSVSVGFPE